MRGNIFLRALALVGAVSMAACGNTATTPSPTGSGTVSADPGPRLDVEPFGEVNGSAVSRYTLTNGRGMRVRILNYGGIVQSLEAPDRDGRTENVVLGFPTLDGYLASNGFASKPYFGAIVGRYANRIAKGTFALDGAVHQVPVNNNGNSLHGGTAGFDQKVWQVLWARSTDTAALRLQYVSPAGEMGYPGTLTATVDYTLDRDNRLTIDYTATTDAPTVVNLTNHTYWNLGGESALHVYDHKLTVHADRYTPTDATQIPTGEIAQVRGTPMDFTAPTPIGARITAADPQLMTGQGYDLNWVLNRGDGTALVPAAEVEDPASGRTLTVETTEPGIQFYSGNFLTGAYTGTGGHAYRQGAGLALETQHFPDSPNRPEFPSTRLDPGQTYHQTTVYRLGTR
ncbi:galactose mutarotase [Nocardia sp. CDC159]|uniref:Aldose 1-epimerase n=1 Tax=Nocardia pulmonis TaxID=2951408 RepID=A0A9X2E3R5_9NOCA|nr:MULTISPECIES: aldose epimerase family protein [Nocardia]MCM6773742.1 galactose mutarotase [Nocardia pulmonis]MCM6786629.1 galactose mutarotase [Nocardia sp. CDC159]